MDIEKLEQAAYSHHKATEAIVDRIVNNKLYSPSFFPTIIKKGEQIFCIVDAHSLTNPNMDYIDAYITMGSFSLELKMKLLNLLETGQWEKGHKLMALYESMSVKSKEHIRKKIKEITKNSMMHKIGSKAINEHCKIQFSWTPHKLIANSSEAFEKWRYSFEGDSKVTWFAGYSEIQQAIDSRISEIKQPQK